MLTHTSPTVSLQGITARLVQARFPSISPLARKNTCLNHTSTPAKISMYPAQSVPRDTAVLRAAPQSKFQQTRARRPYYESNSNRACRQSETTRKYHNQDWNHRHSTDSVKSIPCRPVSRRPFQNFHTNPYEQRPNSYNQCLSTCKVPQKNELMSSQAQSRMSEMYDMIDDHLAWNMSISNSESARPSSSGTMFVDFDADGGIEVSYRKGVNKRLPIPPVPAKSLAEFIPLHQDIEKEVEKAIHGEASRKGGEREYTLSHPSFSLRHDSVTSPGCPEKVELFSSSPYRPQVLQRTSRRSRPYRTRKSYPPQVHRTQSSSPALSDNFASSTRNSWSQTMHMDTPGLKLRYHASSPPSITQSTRSTTPGSTARAYIEDHDTTIKFGNDCNGHTTHIQSSPTPSRPGPCQSEYFEIFTSSYGHSVDHPNTPVKSIEKPLPCVPHSQIEPAVKKRRKSMKFVQNILHKLDGLGATREFWGERQLAWEKGKMKETWAQVSTKDTRRTGER